MVRSIFMEFKEAQPLADYQMCISFKNLLVLFNVFQRSLFLGILIRAEGIRKLTQEALPWWIISYNVQDCAPNLKRGSTCC